MSLIEMEDVVSSKVSPPWWGNDDDRPVDFVDPHDPNPIPGEEPDDED